MVSLTLEKARVSRATLLRLASAIGSAAVFGMLAAPVIPAAYWPSAFALAFIYGFFFVGGTGYRILIAVAFRDASRKASASWSGATTASALAALAAALLLVGQDGHASLVLAAYAVAINVAYIPVKFACLEVGCCHAHRRDPFIIRDHDLRRVEIAASALVLVTALIALWIGAFGVAAIAGIGGHLAIRLLSRWSRDRLPGSGAEDEIKGQELLPLTLMLAAAIWIAAPLQSLS
ncbi:MAG: hypothetical protein VR78_18950 [Hoeflea sp. BRH_c9]|nr:MAG: hypothetical protein VR78_18950 [Hoeflea sp. BRH_c9]